LDSINSILILDLLARLVTSKKGLKRKHEETQGTVSPHQISKPEKVPDDEDNEEHNESSSDSADYNDESEFEGFSDPDMTPDVTEPASVPTIHATSKYIPPSARKLQALEQSDTADDPRLKKQAQGIVNRYFLSNFLTDNQSFRD
jgi:hypothetical protein